jgi:hypothetical protein
MKRSVYNAIIVCQLAALAVAGTAIVLSVACKETVIPTQDASDSAQLPADPATMACTNLAALGCQEGLTFDGGADCVTTLKRATVNRLVPFDLGCMMDAGTKAAARACPGIVCP